MKSRFHYLLLTSLLLPAVYAQGAALSRTDQNVDYLFEDGTYAEIGVGVVKPWVKGHNVNTPPESTGNIGETFTPVGMAIKLEPKKNVLFAFAYGQPFGVDVQYNSPNPATFPTDGIEAHALVHSFTMLAGYRFPHNITVYGGPVYYSLKASATMQGLQYRFSVPKGGAWGALFGAAYQIPEIALRASLTYHTHAVYAKDIHEQMVGATPEHQDTPLNINIPSSVNLHFQTGIAPKTLLITGARWVNWKSFNIDPKLFHKSSDSVLVSYNKNSWEYHIGVGRQLTPKLGAQILYMHDTGSGSPATPMGPTNEYNGVQIGGKYKINQNFDVSAGLQYLWFKNQDTGLSLGGTMTKVGEFNKMRALGAGAKLSMHF